MGPSGLLVQQHSGEHCRTKYSSPQLQNSCKTAARSGAVTGDQQLCKVTEEPPLARSNAPGAAVSSGKQPLIYGALIVWLPHRVASNAVGLCFLIVGIRMRRPAGLRQREACVQNALKVFSQRRGKTPRFASQLMRLPKSRQIPPLHLL